MAALLATGAWGPVPATAPLPTSPDAGKREAAREAYQRAMDAWQVLEVMQIGPAALRSTPGDQFWR